MTFYFTNLTYFSQFQVYICISCNFYFLTFLHNSDFISHDYEIISLFYYFFYYYLLFSLKFKFITIQTLFLAIAIFDSDFSKFQIYNNYDYFLQLRVYILWVNTLQLWLFSQLRVYNNNNMTIFHLAIPTFFSEFQVYNSDFISRNCDYVSCDFELTFTILIFFLKIANL